MTRLNKAQLAILRRMGEGERLVKHFGEYALFCWGAKPRTGPRSDSVKRLMVAGFVDRIAHTGGWDTAYIISPAGRAYLEEHDVQS